MIDNLKWLWCARSHIGAGKAALYKVVSTAFAILLGIWGSTSMAHAPKSEATSASEPKAVVELFTSQGCSSCPPADALFKEYATRADVVALTFPVDYWDYLGWKDTLANPKFSSRQRAYAKRRGDGRIYTPQVVINGAAHVLGSSSQEIDVAITSHQDSFVNARVPLQVRLEKGQLIIDAGSAIDGRTPKDVNIWLAMVQREIEVPIKAGENRGKTLKYFNVVRELTPIGMWNGQPMKVVLDRDSVTPPGANGCAVLMQSEKGGAIVGAAFLGKL